MHVIKVISIQTFHVRGDVSDALTLLAQELNDYQTYEQQDR